MPQLSPIFWSWFPVIMGVVILVMFSILFSWRIEILMVEEKYKKNIKVLWLW